MGKHVTITGSSSGFQFDRSSTGQSKIEVQSSGISYKEDGDLIIEENTVYEIDRECYERLKRQRKHKTPDKRSGKQA